jgi:hypothetical protein
MTHAALNPLKTAGPQATARARPNPPEMRYPTGVHLPPGLGNQAMLRMLRIQSATNGGIQTKLTINSPGDVHEQEADKVAEQVMRMPEAGSGTPIGATAGRGVQRKCGCGGTCAACQANLEEDGQLQMKSNGPAKAVPRTAPPSVHQALRSPGRPLDPATRSFMEPGFGQDFSGVRVHSGKDAALSARRIHANAYTVGRNIRDAQDCNPKFSPATHGLASNILRLQGTIGNRAVQRMLNLEHSYRAAPVRVQPQLRVGAIDDPLEREADRVAMQVMHAAEPAPQAKCACGDTCPKCQVGRATTGTDPGISAPPGVDDVLQTSGQPLDPATRAFMESGFGQDLRHVRVHTDSTAAVSALSMDALAYTVGDHIVFGPNQFVPSTDSGKRLLAHELTHTLQQSGGPPIIRRQADPQQIDTQIELIRQQLMLPVQPLRSVLLQQLQDLERRRALGVVNAQPTPALQYGPDGWTGNSQLVSYYHFYMDRLGYSYQKRGANRGRLINPRGVHFVDITWDAGAPSMTSMIVVSKLSYEVSEFNFLSNRFDTVYRQIEQVEYERKLSILERIGHGVSATSKFVGGVAICKAGTVGTLGFGSVAACAYGADVFASGIDELRGGSGRTLTNRVATYGLSQLVDADTAQSITDYGELAANLAYAVRSAKSPRMGEPGTNSAARDSNAAELGEESARHRVFAQKNPPVANPNLPPGVGVTDKFGNITYSSSGSATDRALALFHETVHSVLSPRLNFLRGMRADFGMWGYQRSAFLKYLEEALAETYAQVRVNGMSGVLTGIRFPIVEGYVTLSRVLTEAAIGTVVYGGVVYGVYVWTSDDATP